MNKIKKKVIALVEEQWQYFYDRRERIGNTIVEYEDIIDK